MTYMVSAAIFYLNDAAFHLAHPVMTFLLEFLTVVAAHSFFSQMMPNFRPILRPRIVLPVSKVNDVHFFFGFYLPSELVANRIVKFEQAIS